VAVVVVIDCWWGLCPGDRHGVATVGVVVVVVVVVIVVVVVVVTSSIFISIFIFICFSARERAFFIVWADWRGYRKTPCPLASVGVGVRGVGIRENVKCVFGLFFLRSVDVGGQGGYMAFAFLLLHLLPRCGSAALLVSASVQY